MFFAVSFRCMAFPDGSIDHGDLLVSVAGINDEDEARNLILNNVVNPCPDQSCLPEILLAQEKDNELEMSGGPIEIKVTSGRGKAIEFNPVGLLQLD